MHLRIQQARAPCMVPCTGWQLQHMGGMDAAALVYRLHTHMPTAGDPSLQPPMSHPSGSGLQSSISASMASSSRPSGPLRPVCGGRGGWRGGGGRRCVGVAHHVGAGKCRSAYVRTQQLADVLTIRTSAAYRARAGRGGGGQFVRIMIHLSLDTSGFLPHPDMQAAGGLCDFCTCSHCLALCHTGR